MGFMCSESLYSYIRLILTEYYKSNFMLMLMRIKWFSCLTNMENFLLNQNTCLGLVVSPTLSGPHPRLQLCPSNFGNLFDQIAWLGCYHVFDKKNFGHATLDDFCSKCEDYCFFFNCTIFAYGGHPYYSFSYYFMLVCYRALKHISRRPNVNTIGRAWSILACLNIKDLYIVTTNFTFCKCLTDRNHFSSFSCNTGYFEYN